MQALVFLITLLIFGASSCQMQDSGRQANVSRIGHESQTLVLGWQPSDSRVGDDLKTAFHDYFSDRYPIRFAELIFATDMAGHSEFLIEVRSLERLSKDSALLARLQADPQVTVASLVYRYRGRGLEGSSTRSSPDSARHRHLESIEAEEAWRVSRGDPSVIIAVTDDGFDFEHQAMHKRFWLNEGELGVDEVGDPKKSNGIDDDKSGYIDDWRGWDFTKAGNNDPSPESGLFFGLDSHGTHIAGILGARHDGPSGQHIKGIAPESPIMALRFSGSGTWNSINIARSYAYAVAQGARIINTSYAIDQYVNDPVYLAALRHAYDSGLLIFNSAGNQGQRNPKRQAIHEIFLVANSYAGPEARDLLNPNSNYGRGIDFVAPGDIYSSIPQNRYQLKVGTSMATPVVAGVAALIWAANPDWSRDQVAARLAASSDSIDHLNPGYEGELGYGRVNARRALSDEPTPPPRLQLEQSRVAISDGRITLRSLAILDPLSLKQAKFLLIDHQGNQWDLQLANEYRIGANDLQLLFPSSLIPGTYDLYISPELQDPFGQALDGNHDGQAGDPMIVELEVSHSHEFSPYVESIELSQSEIAAGERLSIQLAMSDKHGTIKEAQLVFTKYDGSIELTASDRGSEAREEFAFHIDIPKDQDNGFYYLTRLELTHNNGSKSSFHVSPPEEFDSSKLEVLQVGFRVFDGLDYDRIGPELISISLPEIAGMGQDIPVQIQAKDLLSGVKHIEVLLRSAETFQNLRTEKLVIGDGHQLEYELKLALPWLDRRQEFFIAAVLLTDNAGNISRFQASDRSDTLSNSPLRVPRIYVVEDIHSDITPPHLLGVNLITPKAFHEDVATVQVHAIDDESEISQIRVFFRKDFVILTSKQDFKRISDELFEVAVPIRAEDDIGLYRLYKIELEDEMGNKISYQSLNRLEETYPGTEIPVLYLDVKSRKPIDTEGPKIDTIEFNPDWSQGVLYVDIQARDQSGIEYIDLSLIGTTNPELALWSESGIQQTGPGWYRLRVRLDELYQPGSYFIDYLLAADVLGNVSLLQAEPHEVFFQDTEVDVPHIYLP